MKSLLISKGGPTEPKVVTEIDYLKDPHVGLHYSPFNYSAVSYDVLGNIMYENVNHDKHVMNAHHAEMKKIHRSDESKPDLVKALDSISKAAPKGVDEAKYKRCKEKVAEQSPDVNEYAVCTASLKRSVDSALDDLIKACGKDHAAHHNDLEQRVDSLEAHEAEHGDDYREEAKEHDQFKKESKIDKRKSIDGMLDDLIKAGEGSRGGK